MAKKTFEIEDGRISMDDTIAEMINPDNQQEPPKPKTTKSNKSKSILVAIRINSDKWNDFKLLSRIEGKSITEILNGLVDNQIQEHKTEIEKFKEISK